MPAAYQPCCQLLDICDYLCPMTFPGLEIVVCASLRIRFGKHVKLATCNLKTLLFISKHQWPCSVNRYLKFLYEKGLPPPQCRVSRFYWTCLHRWAPCCFFRLFCTSQNMHTKTREGSRFVGVGSDEMLPNTYTAGVSPALPLLCVFFNVMY